MRKLNWLDHMALVLLAISGLNGGIIGFFGVDMISVLCQDSNGLTCLSRFVHGLTGLATAYLLAQFFIHRRKK